MGYECTWEGYENCWENTYNYECCSATVRIGINNLNTYCGVYDPDNDIYYCKYPYQWEYNTVGDWVYEIEVPPEKENSWWDEFCQWNGEYCEDGLTCGRVYAIRTLPKSGVITFGKVGDTIKAHRGIAVVKFQDATSDCDWCCWSGTVWWTTKDMKIVECFPGETKCEGYDLYECQDGRWVLKEQNSTKCGYVPPPPPPECNEGETKCEGYDLYECQDGQWVLIEQNSQACGYQPTPPEEKERKFPYWIIFVGLAGLGGIIYLAKKSKKI